MPKTIGNISLYMGPQQLGGPDDLQQAIVNFIDRAEKRLYIAVQDRHRPVLPSASCAASSQPRRSCGGYQCETLCHQEPGDSCLYKIPVVMEEKCAKIKHRKFQSSTLKFEC